MLLKEKKNYGKQKIRMTPQEDVLASVFKMLEKTFEALEGINERLGDVEDELNKMKNS